ncbi:hypothetical protein ABW19_dt0206909 [Dactylella cylindrospora]|nr:hypothetical protein ABW19_dt0206909 [Dactylella cylindrospora]
MDIVSTCRNLLNPIGSALGRTATRDLENRFESLKVAHKDLTREFVDTKKRHSNLYEYLGETALSHSQKGHYNEEIHSAQLSVNRLSNLIDSVEIKLLQVKNLRGEKQQLTLIAGELESARHSLTKVDAIVAAIRQEIMITLAINDQKESQKANNAITQRLSNIETNTSTQAQRIRASYRKMGLEMLVEDYTIPVPPSPPNSDSGDEGRLSRRVSVKYTGYEKTNQGTADLDPKQGFLNLPMEHDVDTFSRVMEGAFNATLEKGSSEVRFRSYRHEMMEGISELPT